MINKPYLVFYGPVDTFSGYGARSRDLVLSLIAMDKYDIEIISCNWGHTPKGFLNPKNLEHKSILDRIINQLQRQPDVWIMNTIPNEMNRVGKYNILITAGIETNICAPQWIEGCNRADLVLVSSQHAKDVFVNSKFNKHNPQGQVESILQLEKPIEVLFEGVNTNIYFNSPNTKLKELNNIQEDFCFLFVGHWMQGELGEDRKNVGGLIKTFLNTFKDKKQKPALILKTQNASPSHIDKNDLENKINIIQKSINSDNLPNIYLIHGELEDSDMNNLYNHPKVKAHVSFTKGEGFGRPLLEASISAKPVIASGWSGHVDFLNKDFSILLPGNLTPVHPSCIVPDMIIEGSHWFTVDYNKASQILKDVYNQYNKFTEGAIRQAYLSKTKFNFNVMTEQFKSILDKFTPEFKPLVLPKIKKLELPKLNNK